MNQNQNTNVNAKSEEFRRGVEAGLNSEEDTKNWRAGNELGQELSSNQGKDAVEEIADKQSDLPLFLRDRSEGPKGNAQDEKDTTEE